MTHSWMQYDNFNFKSNQSKSKMQENCCLENRSKYASSSETNCSRYANNYLKVFSSISLAGISSNQKFLDVRETVERYLTALKPLVPDFQFAKSEKSVEEFVKSHASKFNSLLNGMNHFYDSLNMTHRINFFQLGLQLMRIGASNGGWTKCISDKDCPFR